MRRQRIATLILAGDSVAEPDDTLPPREDPMEPPKPEVAPVPEEHTKIRKKSEIPWQDMNLAKAQKFLTDRGFVLNEENTQMFQSGPVYHYTNPHTGQRANLAHKTKTDLAKVNFHLMKQPKRRTPDQKYRDNFVLYD